MFDFASMAFDYESRRVDNSTIDGNTVIDTCKVSDGKQPYETGISCPRYNGGRWVIVEAYDTKEDAQRGHNKWVGIMSAETQPTKLVDCCNSYIQQISETLGGDTEFDYE